MVINVARTVIAYPSGMLSEKIGKEKTLIFGSSVFALSSLLIVVLSGKSLYVYKIAVIFSVYVGISETMQRAVIPRYISSELRGTAFGIYNVVAGLAFFVANIIFGLLWDSFSLNSAISYSMITTVIAMTVFVKEFPVNSN
jgi:MFS family permease